MSTPLSLGLLLTGPPSPLLASQICGVGGTFWLNKDFLVDTLTWPVVFGEGLQRQLLGSPLSLVDPDVAHPPGARPQARSALLFSVTSSHILWALATQLGPHLGSGPHHSLTAPFPVILISVPCHICPAPSQTLISLVSLLAETKLFFCGCQGISSSCPSPWWVTAILLRL